MGIKALKIAVGEDQRRVGHASHNQNWEDKIVYNKKLWAKLDKKDEPRIADGILIGS